MNTGSPGGGLDADLDATVRLPTIEQTAGAADGAEVERATEVLPVPAIPVGTLELADQLREVERRFDQKGRRVRELEIQLEQADQRLAALESTLDESRARQAELEVQLDQARAHAQLQSQLMAERRSAALSHHERDLAELRNRTERQLEALTTWQGFRAVSDALLDDAEARNALLEAKVSSLVDSVRALGGSGARTRPQSQSEALKAEVDALQSQIVALRAELAVARQGPGRLGPARAAPARWRDRDAPEVPDVPASASVVMYGEHWEYQEEADDSSPGELEQAPPQPVEAAVRALVRQDGGGGVIYPIGRRTTIGRTPDNDVPIDLPNVSRHHAVLLVNSDQCRIEDLNSTNGVIVNGRRVTRQALQDGDMVTIGKTVFRFMQRS